MLPQKPETGSGASLDDRARGDVRSSDVEALIARVRVLPPAMRPLLQQMVEGLAKPWTAAPARAMEDADEERLVGRGRARQVVVELAEVESSALDPRAESGTGHFVEVLPLADADAFDLAARDEPMHRARNAIRPGSCPFEPAERRRKCAPLTKFPICDGASTCPETTSKTARSWGEVAPESKAWFKPRSGADLLELRPSLELASFRRLHRL